MTNAESRIEELENHRNFIISELLNKDSKVPLEVLSTLEKVITNGTSVAAKREELRIKGEQLKLLEKSEAGQANYREAATAFILAQRERAMSLAQEVRLKQGENPLPPIEARELLPNEGLQGQYQVSFEVLSGQKDFLPEENRSLELSDRSETP